MDFTHIDRNGNAVMVDVSEKAATERTAVARGRIRMSRQWRRLPGSWPPNIRPI